MNRLFILLNPLHILNWINLHYAKYKANVLHTKTNKQYHVIKKGKNSYRVVDNSFINQYNNIIRGKGKKITIYELIKIAYYSTK